MMPGVWPVILESAGWIFAIGWMVRTVEAIRGLPTVPDLSQLERDVWPQGTPSLTVVIPARNEQQNIAATLDALLETDYPFLRVIAIDDRSEDGTGAVLDRYAQGREGTVDVVHIETLPHGWLGKTNAMQTALQMSRSDYILFTDADVLLSPSILRRTIAFAERERADHVVVCPTPILRSAGESVVLGFFQMLGLWVVRPWKVADPKAWDSIGIGAFNFVRREALEALGGFEPQRLTVIEDVALGRRFHAGRFRQRVAFAPGLVLVHWAAGALGLVRVLTKNLYSAVNFQPVLLLAQCALVLLLGLGPIAELAWWRTMLPGLLSLCCIGAMYRLMAGISGVPARYGWLYPMGCVLLVWAMVRSMLAAILRGGVEWRGTQYPLQALRQFNGPFQWDLAARRARREAERAGRA